MTADAETINPVQRRPVQRHRPAKDDFRRQQRREADRREADRRRQNLIHAYISEPLIVAASDGVVALVSWLVYDCSDTVDQRRIPGGSNDTRG